MFKNVLILSLLAGVTAFTPRANVRQAVPLFAEKINDKIDLESKKVVNNEALEAGDKAVYCRCWKSETFPLCDGSHMKWNKETGDNLGPLIVDTPKVLTGAEYLKTMSGGDGPETGGKIPATALWIADIGTPKTMDFMRAAEIKHGRIAMWAFAGWCAAITGTHFPGMLSISQGISFADVAAKNPVDAFFGLPAESIGQIAFFVSLLEWYDMTHTDNKFTVGGNNVLENGSIKPYTNPIDPWGLMKKATPAQLEANKLKELKNGRLAMWGVLGFTCAATIPGSVPMLSGLF